MNIVFSLIAIVPETVFFPACWAVRSRILAPLSLTIHHCCHLAQCVLVLNHNPFLEPTCWIMADVGQGNKQRESRILRKSHYSYTLLLEWGGAAGVHKGTLAN